MSEEKQEKNNTLKQGFFQKVWNSITKIEKYPDMAAEGLGRAFTYICRIVAILAIVLCLGTIYQTHQMLQEGMRYLKEEFPEFTYKEGRLDVSSDERLTISEEDSYVGRTIIDTKTEEEQVINQYINEIEKSGSGMIILKDKVILKNGAIAGTINYQYKELLQQMGITEFTKQNVIDYANSSQIITLYISVFITIFAYSFIMYLLTTLSNAVFLSVLVCCMGAYGLVKFKPIGSNAIFAVILAALMFSNHVTQIPNYMVVNAMGLINSYLSLIIPKVAVAYNFFLVKQFAEQLPDSILEAARIDGCGEFQTFWKIAMPLLKPAWSTLAVFSFVNNWNDYFSPLIFINRNAMKTLPLALQTMAGGAGVVARAGTVGAATLLTTAPAIIVFVIMRGKVMQTMTYSGIKS